MPDECCATAGPEGRGVNREHLIERLRAQVGEGGGGQQAQEQQFIEHAGLELDDVAAPERHAEDSSGRASAG